MSWFHPGYPQDDRLQLIAADSRVPFSYYVWQGRKLRVSVQCNQIGCHGHSDEVVVDRTSLQLPIVDINAVCPICCTPLLAEVHFLR